jgi:hypothetical protein
MNLDEQLLAQKQEGAKTSGESGSLREAQRAGNQITGGADGSPTEPGALSLRETVLAAKKKDGAQAGERGTGGGEAIAPMRRGLSKLLQQAWLNLITSWGLTLIWINIHVFLSYIFGEKLFCKLGEEWKDMIPGAGGAGVAGFAGNSQPPVKGSNECCDLAGCNLGCLFIVIAIACGIAMVLGVITNPLEALKSLLGNIWGAVTGTT